MFYIMFFCNGKWAHVGNDDGTAFMYFSNLVGQFLKVWITFPYPNRISYATLAVDDEKLGMFPTLLGLQWLYEIQVGHEKQDKTSDHLHMGEDVI